MSSFGIGSIVIAFVAMAYLGPAIAIAAHVITREGYLSSKRKMPLARRALGVLEAIVIGLLWLPALIVLLVRALLQR
jgi:hypothetical protein